MIPMNFCLLSDSEIKKIDEQARMILEKTGVRVFHEGALAELESHGCSVDRQSKIVKIPGQLVQDAIDATPPVFSLYGTDPSFKIDLGGDNVHFGPGGFAIFAEDLNGKRHVATREDLLNTLRLSEAMDTVTFNHVNVNASDLPKSVSDLYMWADSFTYQSKPIMNENFSRRSVEAVIEMGAVISGSKEAFLEKPFACLDVCVISPLTHDDRQVELLHLAAEYGIPVSINSGPIGGASAPVTLAGIATQANAELLSAIVIGYCKKPGSKVLYGSWGRHLDMRTTLVTMGGPEYAMLKTTTAQMGRYYGIPTRGGGALSDSLIPDAQAGYEKMITTLIPALSRVNYISGMGLNETENCFSPAQLVIDDEVVQLVNRVLRGIETDDKDIASDVIMDVGPGGEYLSHEHTLANFRDAVMFPELSNRGTYANWEKNGSKSLKTRAFEKAREILAEPVAPIIGQAKADELIRIVKAVEEGRL